MALYKQVNKLNNNIMKNNEVINLFGLVKELTPKKDGYDLQIEFASVYGGYRINWVNNENGGHSDFSGVSRRDKKEMLSWMRGYVKGLETIK